MTTFKDLEDEGWKRLGDGHGTFPTLRNGRVTIETATRCLFIRGEGAVVSQKFRSFFTEEDAAEAALTLVRLLDA